MRSRTCGRRTRSLISRGDRGEKETYTVKPAMNIIEGFAIIEGKWVVEGSKPSTYVTQRQNRAAFPLPEEENRQEQAAIIEELETENQVEDHTGDDSRASRGSPACSCHPPVASSSTGVCHRSHSG